METSTSLTTERRTFVAHLKCRLHIAFVSTRDFWHGILRSVLTTLLVVSAGWHCAAAELHIGGTSVSITPDQPVSLAGQMHTRIARTVESEVTATALALESRDGDQSLEHAILVSCDLVCIRGGLLEAVRQRLKGRLADVDVNKVILNATHTHTAPTMIEGRYELPADGIMRPQEFVEFASSRIADAVVSAWQSRKRRPDRCQRNPANAGWTGRSETPDGRDHRRSIVKFT